MRCSLDSLLLVSVLWFGEGMVFATGDPPNPIDVTERRTALDCSRPSLDLDSSRWGT